MKQWVEVNSWGRKTITCLPKPMDGAEKIEGLLDSADGRGAMASDGRIPPSASSTAPWVCNYACVRSYVRMGNSKNEIFAHEI